MIKYFKDILHYLKNISDKADVIESRLENIEFYTHELYLNR